MICAECQKAGERSVVRFRAVQTALPVDSYFDEDGKLHNHNPNSMTTFFTCSRGHTWNTVQAASCSVCNPPPAPRGNY